MMKRQKTEEKEMQKKKKKKKTPTTFKPLKMLKELIHAEIRQEGGGKQTRAEEGVKQVNQLSQLTDSFTKLIERDLTLDTQAEEISAIQTNIKTLTEGQTIQSQQINAIKEGQTTQSQQINAIQQGQQRQLDLLQQLVVAQRGEENVPKTAQDTPLELEADNKSEGWFG
ncbi:MAG: hypothetical protein FRX48_08833 [Lasallia pustulata]|uniref:Uncharacterized protein n=1 Tax=Lasallia pustulata TaxID=136370 RepID=A0A5M8PDI0_9LECA|nr:MAG: hypothetical protein FRX48_08833 [Lasallia pustulata]